MSLWGGGYEISIFWSHMLFEFPLGVSISVSFGANVQMTQLLLLGLLLNAAGIYCCLQEQSKLKKQKIILLNLSAVEIFIILFTMGHISIAQCQLSIEDTAKANQVLCTL